MGTGKIKLKCKLISAPWVVCARWRFTWFRNNLIFFRRFFRFYFIRRGALQHSTRKLLIVNGQKCILLFDGLFLSFFSVSWFWPLCANCGAALVLYVWKKRYSNDIHTVAPAVIILLLLCGRVMRTNPFLQLSRSRRSLLQYMHRCHTLRTLRTCMHFDFERYVVASTAPTTVGRDTYANQAWVNLLFHRNEENIFFSKDSTLE